MSDKYTQKLVKDMVANKERICCKAFLMKFDIELTPEIAKKMLITTRIDSSEELYSYEGTPFLSVANPRFEADIPNNIEDNVKLRVDLDYKYL